MRLLLIVFNLVGRGTYWRAFHLGKQLAARGHRVTLLAQAPAGQAGFTIAFHPNMTLVASPATSRQLAGSGYDLVAALLRLLWLLPHHFDLVHGFECRPTVLLPALATSKRLRLPLVLDWCDWFGRGGSVEERSNPLTRLALRPVESFFEERFRHLAAGTTVICSTLYAKALALGVQADTMLTLCDGADIEAIKPIERSAARAALGLPLEGPLIGYVGAIFPRDAQLMAAAYRELRSRQPDARLLLIGYGNYPAGSLPADGVMQTGAVPYGQLPLYFGACDLCWLPLCDSGANRGRWPLKLNDYMAAGRATVATAVGDVGPLMERQPIGLLCAAQPMALAAATYSLLNDAPRRMQMEHTARQVAENEFDWRLRAASLEQFYAMTLARFYARNPQ
jgi:glycosyltransferase involved in cell wall biosynthesis